MAGHIGREAVEIRRGLGVLWERGEVRSKDNMLGWKQRVGSAGLLVSLEYGDCVPRKEFVVRTRCITSRYKAEPWFKVDEGTW